MSSSASNCIELGTSMPSALAVSRLMTNSNLVDCNTGKSAGFAPLESLTGIDADLTKHVRTIGRVAHQPTGFDSLARGIARRNAIARCERRKLDASAREEHVASDIQGLRAVAHEVGEGGLDFAESAGVEKLNLKAEGAGSFRHIS